MLARTHSGKCSVHSAAPSVVQCSRCSTTMCDVCFRFFIGERAACVRCAHELATRRARRASLGILTFLVGAFAGFVLASRAAGEGVLLGAGIGLALGGVFVGILIARTGRFGDARLVVEQRGERGVPDVLDDYGPQWLATLRRALGALVPATSAYGTAWIVTVAIAFSALSFPMAFRFPVLVEIEIVLGVTYLLIAAMLAYVLYRGERLEDDRVFVAPQWPWKDVDEATATTKQPASTTPIEDRTCSSLDGCDGCGSPDGCDEMGIALAAIVAIILVISVVIVFAWVVVEVALPLVFVLCYELVLAAVHRASRESARCKGRLVPSVAYGASYAALYLAPLVLGTLVLQRALTP